VAAEKKRGEMSAGGGGSSSHSVESDSVPPKSSKLWEWLKAAF
jgi:hypothetical protein